jgi:tetratricopeptide (TPR) repeat protein
LDRSFGQFTLQPHRQLLAAGEPVHVGGKALDVLSVLVAAEGQLVTKDELMHAVWPNSVVEENALQVHISALRKVLGSEAHRLTAVWGRGYRFNLLERPAHGTVTPLQGLVRFGRRGRLIAVLIGFVLLCGFALAMRWPVDRMSAVQKLPADPQVSAIYLQARDNLAVRSSASLREALRELQTVVERDPGFAPGHAALADAYLLTTEYGDLAPNIGYPRAMLASQRALELDPNLADAHRSLGFVQYWFMHDTAAAGKSFRRAIALAPGGAEAHFWYADVLADNGEYAAAEREFAAARLGNPGSLAIETDHGWALWMAGREEDGKAKLHAVLARNPGFAEAWNDLVLTTMVEGDLPGFVQALKQRERSRQSQRLNGLIAKLEVRLAAQDRVGFGQALFESGMHDQASAPFPDHSWAALVASEFDRRDLLLKALEAAEANREKWGVAGYVQRIAARWPGEPQIQTLLARRRSGLLEPPDRKGPVKK